MYKAIALSIPPIFFKGQPSDSKMVGASSTLELLFELSQWYVLKLTFVNSKFTRL